MYHLKSENTLLIIIYARLFIKLIFNYLLSLSLADTFCFSINP